MAKHGLSEEALELEAMKKVVALGCYTSVDAFSETFGDDGMFGRKTPEEVVLPSKLKQALAKLNPDLPNEAIDNALYPLINNSYCSNL